jgi:NAD(P)-dependent dehydrogenase (short-subunit alcohol dehydrogenase family)
MKTLNEKVIVITGAGSGIGRALALDIAGRGARLALSDWDTDGLGETASLVKRQTGAEPRTDRLDVRDRVAMQAYAASVAEEFGVVNVVINNAGIALHGDFEDVTYEQFERIIDVDLWGVVHGTKEFLPYLIASGDGYVVNISSLFGLMGVPGQTAYNAAKFAVRGFSEALRQEMLVNRHPVGVTCVHPGGIKTAIARNAEAAGNADQATFAEFFDQHLARTTAERAASEIVKGILRKRARVVIGLDAKALDLLVRVTGPRYQRGVAAVTKRVLDSRLRT